MANFEPLNSPLGYMFISPETEQILSCALGLHHPVNVAALKAELSATVVTCHPRFSSLLVDDPRPSSQTQYWRKTHVNIDDHVVVVGPFMGGGDDEASVNAYLADLAVSSPLSKDKPLWEVHVLVGLNCLVFRMHHAIGDGNSLMSMLVACFGGEKTAVVEEKKRRWGWGKGGLWSMMKSVWYTAMYQAAMMGRMMGVRDEKTVLSGGEGVELWPRAAWTAKFKIEDMKEVKKAIPNATLNDVMLGVVSCGFEKYLNHHSPNAMSRGIKMTTILTANIRKHSGFQEMTRDNGVRSSLGNKIGSFLVPMKFHKSTDHPLQHVRRMKAIMDHKKQSLEAQLSYILPKRFLSYLGPRAIIQSQKKLMDATTLCMSNIVGPKEDIVIAGSHVSYLRLGLSSVCQAVTLTLVSYKGNAELQVLVAKDIIQDGDFLAQCFEKALLEMVHVCQY